MIISFLKEHKSIDAKSLATTFTIPMSATYKLLFDLRRFKIIDDVGKTSLKMALKPEIKELSTDEILMFVLAEWISLSLDVGRYSVLTFVNVACSDAIWVSDDGELYIDFSVKERYSIKPVKIRVPPELLRRLKLAFDNNRKTVLTYISHGR